MALSPITPMNIQWENVLVDIQPTSAFGAEHDIAMVNTTMLLQAPAAEDVIFALPAIDTPEQAPVLRVVGETAGAAHEFAETTFDDVEKELREAFRQARRDDMAFYELLRKEAHSVSFARVKIEQGEQLVRFHYPHRIPRLPDGSFEFRILAPLASFILNPGGGDISFIVGLPRIAGRTTQLLSATAENPPGTPATAISEQATIAQRQLLGHYVRQDPLYLVKYQYA
jgi:hypothetical protein